MALKMGDLVLDSEIVIDASGQPNTVYFMAYIDAKGFVPFDGVAWIESGRMVVDRVEYRETP
jgi:hypothetical protein